MLSVSGVVNGSWRSAVAAGLILGLTFYVDYCYVVYEIALGIALLLTTAIHGRRQVQHSDRESPSGGARNRSRPSSDCTAGVRLPARFSATLLGAKSRINTTEPPLAIHESA